MIWKNWNHTWRREAFKKLLHWSPSPLIQDISKNMVQNYHWRLSHLRLPLNIDLIISEIYDMPDLLYYFLIASSSLSFYQRTRSPVSDSLTAPSPDYWKRGRRSILSMWSKCAAGSNWYWNLKKGRLLKGPLLKLPDTSGFTLFTVYSICAGGWVVSSVTCFQILLEINWSNVTL